MLRSFRLGNHRSFREEHELLLMPAKPSKRTAVMPVAAVYGANASGKSSLLDGLQFMRRAVVESFQRWDAEGGVPRVAFRLDRASQDKPSVFSVEIVVDGVPYDYGFTVDDEKVLEEWVYSYPEKRPRLLFERKDGRLRFGSTVGGDLKSKMGLLGEMTRPNALFLSACAQVQVDELMPIYRWFRFQLKMRMSGSDPAPQRTASKVLDLSARNPHLRDRLTDLLKAADVGITGYSIEESVDPGLRRVLEDFSSSLDRLRHRLRASTDKAERQQLERDVSEAEAAVRVFSAEADSTKAKLFFYHGADRERFAFGEESAGTRSWVALLPMVLEALDNGHVVAVDEIDTSLHPLLTVQLINLFRDPEVNQNGAQLIFTSHDTSLLGPLVGQELDRDEVWFVAKDREGASTLYPLTDFKPRAEYNNERRYLGGSYGAVPMLDSGDFAEAVRRR